MEQSTALPWLQEHSQLEEQVRQTVVDLKNAVHREGLGNALAERLEFAAAFCRLAAHARTVPTESE